MYKRRKRGQSAIEWGLLIPFLILIISSVLELSPLMSSIMVVDKATQYTAASAAKKGTTNKQLAYNYIMNMQGLMTFEDFLIVDIPINKDGDPTNDVAFENAAFADLALKPHELTTTSQQIDPLGQRVVNPSVFKIESKNVDDLTVDTLTIVPGQVVDRYSGSWVSVTGKHEYKILTPLLQAVLGGACDTGANKGVFLTSCNYFPILKSTIYRVE